MSPLSGEYSGCFYPLENNNSNNNSNDSKTWRFSLRRFHRTLTASWWRRGTSDFLNPRGAMWTPNCTQSSQNLGEGKKPDRIELCWEQTSPTVQPVTETFCPGHQGFLQLFGKIKKQTTESSLMPSIVWTLARLKSCPLIDGSWIDIMRILYIVEKSPWRWQRRHVCLSVWQLIHPLDQWYFLSSNSF